MNESTLDHAKLKNFKHQKVKTAKQKRCLKRHPTTISTLNGLLVVKKQSTSGTEYKQQKNVTQT